MASRTEVGTPAEQAPLVFIGHVVTPKVATLPGIAADDTAIVAVDHVVTAPALFTALAGSQITVRFGKLAMPPTGSPRTFHTRGWIYGQGIAVDAVRVEAEQSKPAAAATLRGARTSARDDALASRLKTAQIGVVGEVTAVKPAEIQTTRISEHDPVWHEATIRVDEVVKGKKGTGEVSVVFPQSDDVRWHRVRKFSPGQRGIWLLHKGSAPAARGLAPKAAAALTAVGDALTAVDAADFLPLEELGRVKALLKK
jgi:hypothetical protein